MRAKLPQTYEQALAKVESNFLAGIAEVVVSDPRVQIYSTPAGGISVKVHGKKSKWLYRAFLRFLKNRGKLQKSWKDRVGLISYTPKKTKE